MYTSENEFSRPLLLRQIITVRNVQVCVCDKLRLMLRRFNFSPETKTRLHEYLLDNDSDTAQSEQALQCFMESMPNDGDELAAYMTEWHNLIDNMFPEDKLGVLFVTYGLTCYMSTAFDVIIVQLEGTSEVKLLEIIRLCAKHQHLMSEWLCQHIGLIVAEYTNRD